jgi:CheY-like chemotaxis protein
MEKHSGPPLVLVAEDNVDDCLIACRAWEESRLKVNVRFVHNGIEVMDFLYRRRKFQKMAGQQEPRLIILDLNMPRMDGRQVLLELGLNQLLSHIPVVVFSDSRMPKDMAVTETLGAVEFISKPENFQEYVKIIQGMGQFLFKERKRLACAIC